MTDKTPSEIASLVATRPAQRAAETACEQAAHARNARAEAINATLAQFEDAIGWICMVHLTRLRVHAQTDKYDAPLALAANARWTQRQVDNARLAASTSIIDVLRVP